MDLVAACLSPPSCFSVIASQETLDQVRRVEAERGAGAPAVQGTALGDFPKTRAVLDTLKGSLDTF